MTTIITSAVRRHRRGVLPVLAALAAALMLPAGAEASTPITAVLLGGVVGQAQFGTVKGRLVWGGDEVPPVQVLQEKGKAANNPEVCARDKPILSRELVVDPQTKGVAYAFAYISRPKGENPGAIKDLIAKHPKAELDQKNCEFVPYVLPIYEGQTLIVKASDPGINHNVRLSPFKNPGLNQNVASGAELEVKLVAEKLPIEIKCDIHPWMKCYVMVFDHPFFATTAKDGSFEIKGVPAGTQNLVLWQERVGFATSGAGRGMAIEVKAGELTDVGNIVLDAKKANR